MHNINIYQKYKRIMKYDETQLNALGMKKSEIKKLKDEVKEEVTE